jgi:hypothetical protein
MLVINLDDNKSLIGTTITYTIQGTEEGSGQGCGGLGPGTDSFVVLCSLQSPWNNCPFLDVTDEDVNQVVSGSPPPQTDWVVGLRKTLKVGVHSGSGSGSYSATATSWSAPANAVKSYDFGANTTNAPTPLTALSSPQLRFYWQKGNNSSANKFNVQQELILSDMMETAVPLVGVAYLVNTPGGISVGATYSVTQVGKYNPAGSTAVSSGTALNYPSSAGIELDFKATAPSAIPGYAGGGDFAASQVILSSHDTTSTLPAADGCALYTVDTSGGNGTGRNLFASGGQSVKYNAIDAPAEFGLPASGKEITYGDSFIDYFVYRPSGTNAIWVSLGSLSWAWGATVTNNGGTYVLTNVTNSNQATKSYSTTEPVWKSINAPLGSGCHSLPTH